MKNITVKLAKTALLLAATISMTTAGSAARRGEVFVESEAPRNLGDEALLQRIIQAYEEHGLIRINMDSRTDRIPPPLPAMARIYSEIAAYHTTEVVEQSLGGLLSVEEFNTLFGVIADMRERETAPTADTTRHTEEASGFHGSDLEIATQALMDLFNRLLAGAINDFPDADGDGWTDNYEKGEGSDPNDPSSEPSAPSGGPYDDNDDDGFANKHEENEGSDPNDPDSTPEITAASEGGVWFLSTDAMSLVALADLEHIAKTGRSAYLDREAIAILRQGNTLELVANMLAASLETSIDW